MVSVFDRWLKSDSLYLVIGNRLTLRVSHEFLILKRDLPLRKPETVVVSSDDVRLIGTQATSAVNGRPLTSLNMSGNAAGLPTLLYSDWASPVKASYERGLAEAIRDATFHINAIGSHF